MRDAQVPVEHPHGQMRHGCRLVQVRPDALVQFAAGPLVNARYGASDMPKFEQRVIEFFCAGAGGPETCAGKDMLATHKGMNISEQEFVTVVDDAMAALETHHIDPATRNDVLAILWSLKG